jgi:hypothetical protein
MSDYQKLQKLNCPKCDIALNRQAEDPEVLWCAECGGWFDLNLKSVPGLNEADGSRRRWYILLGVALALVAGTIVFNWLSLRGHAWEARGSFGDMFGMANTIFSGLAFALLILTVLMQKEELELQRKELRDTRKELTRTAEAQEKSEKALNEQLEELIRQRRLSVMPAFIFHPPPRNQGSYPRLSNIGIGGALNVEVSSLSFAGDGEQDINISFKPIVYMQAKDESHLEMVSNEMFSRGIEGTMLCANKLNNETYDLVVNFQDIEGRAYKQIMKIDKAHCIPQPVTAVNL